MQAGRTSGRLSVVYPHMRSSKTITNVSRFHRKTQNYSGILYHTNKLIFRGFFLCTNNVNNIIITLPASNPDIFLVSTGNTAVSLGCVKIACVDVADGVVFIVAGPEVGTGAGTVRSVFCGVIGNFSDAGNADALTVIDPFVVTGMYKL